MKIKMNLALLLPLLSLLAFGTSQAQVGTNALSGQSVNVLRATGLRADKLASAPILQSLPVGTTLRLVSVEGGWLLVETTQPKGMHGAQSGWIRASAVNWQAGKANTADLASGRDATGNLALTLGVRSLPPRANRHALIIGVSRYADPATPQLPGARIDKQSATQMAQTMQVPLENIDYLQDEQATGGNIRQALQALSDRVQEGDRVFIHFSGHGTRYNDPVVGGCVEALLAYDGGQSGTITNREMASLLKTITNKTDKLFVMYDACHSGGVAQAAASVRTRGVINGNDEGALRPKFSSTSEACGRPDNIKNRSLSTEASLAGALPQDIIHISASRENEISFDDEQKGGLATQYVRDCMLRDAKDLDNSGAITMDEIRQCAQEKINRRMANDPNFKPHHLMLNGNAGFVPAWFSQASAASLSSPLSASLASPPAVPIKPVALAVPVLSMAVAPEPLTGEQALKQMFDQRDAKRKIQVTLDSKKLRIGQDLLGFSVQSDRSGFVYVAMAGSDNKTLNLLFPNDLDKNNQIEADQQLMFPRPNWRVTANGPEGVDNLLVIVADTQRDFSSLANGKNGPFVTSLNDAQGRAQLGALMTTAAAGGICTGLGNESKRARCSEAYGATMVAVEELK